MTDAILAAATDYAPTILAAATLFTSIVSGIIALGSWISSLRNKAAITEVNKTVDEVKAQTDGLTAKLVVAEKILSKAEGKVEERAEVAEREDAQKSEAPAEVVVVNPPDKPVPTKTTK